MSTCCPFTNELVIITELPVAVVYNIIAAYLNPYTPEQLLLDPYYNKIYHYFKETDNFYLQVKPIQALAEIYWAKQQR